MAATYIISFDVGSSGDHDGLVAAIKKFPRYAQVTSLTWVVVTNNPAKAVRDRLEDFLGEDGRLFVVKSGTQSAWRRTVIPSEWLKENL